MDGRMDERMEILGYVKESLTSYTCTLADLGPTYTHSLLVLFNRLWDRSRSPISLITAEKCK